MPHCVCALASDSLLGFVDVDDVMRKVSLFQSFIYIYIILHIYCTKTAHCSKVVRWIVLFCVIYTASTAGYSPVAYTHACTQEQ